MKISSHKPIFMFFLLAGLAVGRLYAVDYTWKGTAGGWTDSTLWNSSAPGSYPDGTDDNVVGNGGTGKADITTNLSIGSLSPTTAGWSIGTVTGSGPLTLTISSLTMSNTFTSGINLTFSSASLNNNLSVEVGQVNANGGTLNFGSVSTASGANYLGGLNVTGGITLNGNAASVNISSRQNYNLGLLTSSGTGTASTLTLARTTSGGTGVAVTATTSGITGTTANPLLIRANGAAAAAAAGSVVTLEIKNTSNYTSNAVFSDGDATNSLKLLESGAGVQNLTGASTFSGGTTITAGTLLVSNTTGSGLGSGNVVVNGGILGGTGGFSGAVTVNSGGTLAPGASIQSLASGATTLNNGSTFAYKADSSVATSAGAALLVVAGDINLNNAVTLTLGNTASTPTVFLNGTTFSLINYTGSWNNGLFTYDGVVLSDGAQFSFNGQLWQIDYNATTGGLNFTGDQVAGNFVNIVAVPEPQSLALMGLALSILVFRRFRSLAV